MNHKARLRTLVTLCLVTPVVSHAHHSFSEYDQNHPIELQGTLTEIHWQNPHVHFTLQTKDKNGFVKTWDAETNSLSILRRTNATADDLKAGQTVKMAGWPSKASGDRLFVTNVLQANGRELVLDLRTKPRWSATAAGLKTTWFDGAAPGPEDSSLFHVWASDLADRASVFPWKDPSQYPLTAKAKEALAKWDPVRDTIARGCEPKGMPSIIEQPYPIEFVDHHDSILLRMEEYDTVRTIHMAASAAAESQPKTRLGYSMGHWEGKTLVVNTSRIDWRYFDPSGVPQGGSVSIVEHFTPSTDGSHLNYAMLVTDPETFTQPVELHRAWVRRPGEAVKPYNCTPAKPRG